MVKYRGLGRNEKDMDTHILQRIKCCSRISSSNANWATAKFKIQQRTNVQNYVWRF